MIMHKTKWCCWILALKYIIFNSLFTEFKEFFRYNLINFINLTNIFRHREYDEYT